MPPPFEIKLAITLLLMCLCFGVLVIIEAECRKVHHLFDTLSAKVMLVCLAGTIFSLAIGAFKVVWS